MSPDRTVTVAPRGGAADTSDELRLDSNEGVPPDPATLGELLADPALLARYPDASALEARLARRHGVPAGQVVVTAGGDEALERICRTLLGPSRPVVLPEPTFGMIRRYSALARADVDSVPWPGGAFPVRGVLAAVRPDTGAVFVVSPNNPTGAVATRADLEAVAAGAAHTVLVVDAAYAEFGGDDLTAAALALPNAVVVRTFSKAWGLAGCRVGYVVGADPALMRRLRSAAGPYPVSGLSLALALRRLDDDVRPFVARVRGQVAQLQALLTRSGARCQPSAANFVLARFADAGFVFRGLASLGVRVRRFDDAPGLGDALRITCPGAPGPFARLCDALQTVLRPQALLFDLDGVLADVGSSYRRAITETAAAFGAAVTDADIDAAKAEGAANDDWQLTRWLLRARGIDVSLDVVVETFEALYQGGLWRAETPLVARAALDEWRRRVPLAIVTGWPRAEVLRFLARQGLADRFAAVVCREDAARTPDPAPVRLALQQLGVARAWMLGGTPDDVRAARAAGALPIAVLPPGASARLAESLRGAGAACVLDRITDLDGILP